jgi:hypothetical protein
MLHRYEQHLSTSSIRTITVGSGIEFLAPDLLTLAFRKAKRSWAFALI